jgi:hypothetical protein
VAIVSLRSAQRAFDPIALSFVALLGALVFAAPAQADDDQSKGVIFTLRHNDHGLAFGEGDRDFILADDYFVADTADKFEQFLQHYPPSDVHAIAALNSPGPLVSSGLALGRSIRSPITPAPFLSSAVSFPPP